VCEVLEDGCCEVDVTVFFTFYPMWVKLGAGEIGCR
jgi:hypothetical protein